MIAAAAALALVLTSSSVASVDDDRLAALMRPDRASATQGIAASAYTGTLHDAATERFRLCVIERESKGNYRALNTRSGAAGAYQFLPAWRDGLPYMVADLLVRDGVSRADARAVRRVLSSTPIERWPRAMQDTAFHAALHARGPFSGAHHWHASGSRCNPLGGMN